MNAQQVADIFVEQQVLQPSQAEDVLQEAQLNGKTVEQALIDSGFVDQRGFYQVIADALATEFVELDTADIPQEILRLIPAGLARLHRALPIAMNDNTLDVALVDPLDLLTVGGLSENVAINTPASESTISGVAQTQGDRRGLRWDAGRPSPGPAGGEPGDVGSVSAVAGASPVG